MWFVSCALARPAPAPVAVVVDNGDVRLSLGPTVRPPPTGASDGYAWREPEETTTLGGTSVGDAWLVYTGDGHRVACTVSGFVALAVDAQGWGTADDPTCGGWSEWAMLACEGPVTAEAVAVRAGRNPARALLEAPASARDLGLGWMVMGSRPDWQDSLQRAAAVAPDVHTDLNVRVYGSWRVVEATVWTGDGYSWCGSEDFVERWVTVLDARGGVVSAPRSFETVDKDTQVVYGVYDLDRDGRPELRVVKPLESVSNVGPDGEESAVEPIRFCGCPC